jgi:hypothetical protein
MINEDRRLRRRDPNAHGVWLMAFGAEGIRTRALSFSPSPYRLAAFVGDDRSEGSGEKRVSF